MRRKVGAWPNGRLVKYDIDTGECSVVLGELFFANGIAVSPDETYVLVNETMRYRVRRVYVRGPRAGQVEVFVNNLPGFPDGISTGADGVFWLAVFAPRNPLLDAAGQKPWRRKAIDHFSKTTSAEQVGDWLYVGSLQEPQWGEFVFPRFREQQSPLLAMRRKSANYQVVAWIGAWRCFGFFWLASASR